MTGSAVSAMDVLINAIAFFNDGKRSEAEWTFCARGIKESGVPGREGSRIGRDRRVADDGKRSEAEWTLHNAGIKGEGGSGGRGSPVGSRPRVADLSKMVPKMNPHFTCLGGRFWGYKIV